MIADDMFRETLLDLYEEAPCGYVFTLLDGTLVRVNRTFLSWTGYSREELESRRFQDLLSTPGKMFYETHYAPLLRLQGSVTEVAFDVVCADGSRLPVLINSAKRSGGESEPPVVASTIFAAPDRRAYEQELLSERIRAEHLAEVVTASTDAIVTCGIDGSVEQWNRSAETLFGYTGEQFKSLDIRRVLPFHDDGGFDHMLQSLLVGASITQETVATGAAGQHLEVSVSLTPHNDDVGRVCSVSAIIRDISERRAVERLQQEFLAMAGHELRTPVTSIRARAQLMQRRGVYNERGLASIITQTDQLNRLIGDLLLASQIEANRLQLNVVDVDLMDILDRAVEALVAERDVHIEAPRRQVTIRGDRDRLVQVFSNLLANAVKYSPQGGTITVSLSMQPGQVRVDVIDQGVGIAPEDVPHVFNRFYRAADVGHRFQGTGLGLYITRRIVEGHRGSVGVQSELGRGSTFTVMLPADSAETPLAAGVDRTQDLPADASSSLAPADA